MDDLAAECSATEPTPAFVAAMHLPMRCVLREIPAVDKQYMAVAGGCNSLEARP